MADKPIKLGQRVLISERGHGSVAYVGTTQFATGKWFGVILDEPRGKNNGTVQGKEYFKCGENCGTFVRQSQLTLLDDAGNPIKTESLGSSPSSLEDKNRSRLSNSRLSLIGSRSPSDLSNRASSPVVSKEATTPLQSSENMTSKRASFIEDQMEFFHFSVY